MKKYKGQAMIYKTPLTTKYQATLTPLLLLLQFNLSNPTHQGTNEVCRIVQGVGKLRFYL
jgi:hypothetical protein